MALPIYQSQGDQPLMLLQTNWASQLNPIISNPLTNPRILKGVVLTTGVNTINTGLVNTLQGWFLSDITTAVTVYRSSPKAPLTLTLTASGSTTCDIVVF